MIYRFQPYSTDKSKFGEVYNAHCASVPSSDDWIQIMDWDAMILCNRAYGIIDRAIALHPDTDIFGAVTNRVGYVHQRLDGKISENYDILQHHLIARTLATKFEHGFSYKAWTVAGFFMLFKKSYWERNPFPEQLITNGKNFDKIFCQGAKDMRIISGLYVFHQYRMIGDHRSRRHLLSNEQPNDLTNSPQS